MSDNDDLSAERDRLQAEVIRLRVERDTGVPASMLSNATSEEEARVQAAEALAWKVAGSTSAAPRQQTAAVSPYASPGQISRDTLKYLSADQVSAVYRQGRLEGIGAPPPPPRRNGEPHRNPH
jgi:hypothetical protein